MHSLFLATILPDVPHLVSAESLRKTTDEAGFRTLRASSLPRPARRSETRSSDSTEERCGRIPRSGRATQLSGDWARPPGDGPPLEDGSVVEKSSIRLIENSSC